MGSYRALEMADAYIDGFLSLRSLVIDHLTDNCYPPMRWAVEPVYAALDRLYTDGEVEDIEVDFDSGPLKGKHRLVDLIDPLRLEYAVDAVLIKRYGDRK